MTDTVFPAWAGPSLAMYARGVARALAQSSVTIVEAKRR
jgi:hypothetical protein